MPTKLKIHFDGACDNMGHPPLMGIGVAVFVNGVQQPDLDHAELVGVGTSNIAEYQALIKALLIAIDYCEKNPDTEVFIFGDSQLIVYQFKGHWECRKKHLRVLYEQAKNLEAQLGKHLKSVGWVRREFNTSADILSKKAFA